MRWGFQVGIKKSNICTLYSVPVNWSTSDGLSYCREISTYSIKWYSSSDDETTITFVLGKLGAKKTLRTPAK